MLIKKGLTLIATTLIFLVQSGISPQSTLFFYEPEKPNEKKGE